MVEAGSVDEVQRLNCHLPHHFLALAFDQLRGHGSPQLNKAQDGEKSLQDAKRAAKKMYHSGKCHQEYQLLKQLQIEQAFHHILMGGYWLTQENTLVKAGDSMEDFDVIILL